MAKNVKITSATVTGKKYKSHFEAINFDMTLFDQAAEKAQRLATLYATAFVEKRESDAKRLRDRAFTFMRNIMSDVVDVAEYVFRKDRSRLSYYYSAYRSRKRNSAAEEPENTPVSETAA